MELLNFLRFGSTLTDSGPVDGEKPHCSRWDSNPYLRFSGPASCSLDDESKSKSPFGGIKFLFMVLLLAPAIALGAEGDGRYSASSNKETVLVDSKTGKSWLLFEDEVGPTYRPVLFKCGHKQWSELPDCPKDKMLDARPNNSKIEYLDDKK